MKHLPYALFDMDGTLVDSMTYWMLVPLEYAHTLMPDMTPEQQEQIYLNSTYSGMQELLSSWGVEITIPDLINTSAELMCAYYRDKIDLKRGVPAILEKLKANGTKMGIITMTPHRDVELCLARTGLDQYISFVLTPEDTTDGSGKEKPEIFGLALEKLGATSPQECMFFEDSLYAARTAHELGFYLVGVYDKWAESEEVEKISDLFLNLDECGFC